VLGNDVSTDYVHDRETFRLIRLTSRRGDGTPLQDLHHTYDPVGNLTQLVDACVPTVWFDGAIVTGESTYAYDPLYELTSASGREHAGQLAFGATDNAFDAAMLERHDPSDVLAWQNYTQRYAYDAAGNITQTAHSVQGGGGWTRDLAYAADSNRLLTSTVGPNSYAYAHHPAHGYVTAMPQLSLMRHTFKDELAAVARQVVNAGTPETTWYVYDGDGTRLRKVVERAAPAGGRGAKRFERYTIDGTELEREYDGAGALSAQRRTLHVMDDKDRVALVESELTPAGDVARRLIRYQGADQLGSSRLETDAAGRVVSYELYHPFGTTAYQAVDKTIVAAAKRFRYTGMERDDESGLEYHSARYYAPWLGRWIAPDTHADKLDGNRYAYVKNNPVVRRDRNGLFEEPVHGLLTYRLALAAGFSAQDAAKIAIATAGMDHNVQTRPGEETGERVEHILTGVTQEYHFLPQDKALGLIEGDIAGGVKDLDAFGKHLHTLEDVGFKDAPGPHNRSNDRALAPVVGIVGMTLLSAGVITILEAARGNWSTGALVGAGIAAAVGIAAGLFAIIFSFIALDVGHPTYETERGEHSHSFSHVADEAFQDPKANTKELLLIYDELRRAAVASGRAIGPADEAMARQAIRDVVGSDLAGHVGEGADNATDINRMLNAKQTDVLGGEAASYATVVNEMSSWRKDQIDVSLDRGREYEYAP
jgi:RHS repeat-associated protein